MISPLLRVFPSFRFTVQGILLALMLCTAGLPVRAADGPAQVAQSQLSVDAIVWGIIGYTRWPAQPEVLRVCLAGDSEHVEAIRRGADWVSPERQAMVRPLAPDEDPAADCELVYFGTLAADTRAQLLGQIAGKPVLTIGEGGDFCSAGGMFCLEQDGPLVRFSVNLDAISRSSLRINPQVLRLSRQLSEVES